MTQICALGYLSTEYGFKITDAFGNVDLVSTKLGLFIYVILYRPIAEPAKPQTFYMIVYNPTILYHELVPGCISLGNVLSWEVEAGDLLGVFIPDNCTTLDDLSAQDNVNTFNDEMDLMEFEFCPSQINLVNDPGQCFHALYLDIPDEGSALDQIETFDIQQAVHVSTRLNMNVTIEKGKN